LIFNLVDDFWYHYFQHDNRHLLVREAFFRMVLVIRISIIQDFIMRLVNLTLRQIHKHRIRSQNFER
jgi:hypothetical protein